MEHPVRTEGRPPEGPRIRYPMLLGGLAVVAFLALIIVIVIVVQVTAPADPSPAGDDAAPARTSTPPAVSETTDPAPSEPAEPQ